MEFILNEYHRNVSREELLEDLISVSVNLGKRTVTRAEYVKYGKYHSSTFEKHFKTWSNALTEANLKTNAEVKNACPTISDFVSDVKRIAEQLKKVTITSTEYKRFGKFSYSYYQKQNLGWNDVLKMAGLNSTQYRLGKDKKISDFELFEDIERVWIKLGKQPTITDLKNGHFKFGQNTFVRRFGGWRGALSAFVDYINSEENHALNNTERVTEQCIEDSSKPEEQIIHHNTRREPNLRLKFKVMMRDNFKCCYCGRSPSLDPSVTLHVDHIVPWVKGGETTYENLCTSCQECNLGKSDLML